MTSTKNLKGQSRETKLINIQRGDRRNLKSKGKGPRWANKHSLYKLEKQFLNTDLISAVSHLIIWWLTVLTQVGMCHRHSKRPFIDFARTTWMVCHLSSAPCHIEGRFSHRPRDLKFIRCHIWKNRNGKAWLRM